MIQLLAVLTWIARALIWIVKILVWPVLIVVLVTGVLIIDRKTLNWTEKLSHELGEIWKDFQVNQNWGNFSSWISGQWNDFWAWLNLDIGSISLGILLIVGSIAGLTWLWRHRH